MSASSTSTSTWYLCLRLSTYARRRWPAAVGVLATTGSSVGISVLRPWPMNILVDYVWSDRRAPETLQRWLT